MNKGIDFTTPLTQAKAKEVAATGIEFVCRYLVPARYAHKRITKAEAQNITNAGMKIVCVFESTADRVKGGAEAGRIDGKLALAETKLVGQPIGTTVYFAVDYDAPATDYDIIEEYLRNAFVELPGYAVGVYGSYAVVEEMYRRKACTHFWQTYAWSKGKLSEHTNVYQYKNGVNVCGINADLNNSFGNEGWWNLQISYTLIKKGATGEMVIALQNYLNDHGNNLKVDGDFGALTETAVKEFQKKNDLVVDGIVGKNTWDKLIG
jgi:peptidoglycan hydrolase-like protein with peptidoglycan-binding domain